ncbi:tyrosine-type recombinase/integrase [Rhodopseudomonas sp. BR0C11]|uniref:tyrosine-type recombinase/integrase n=1 Tax=Rhodopseudomonas sp. BR0C11 TaxID=2269370 RepID=UPI0013DF231C|nr:tyrosine-type recombinase/integrase [Rhodopseudomonas sp. BR0C11]NEV77916.1 tyrosine-type recombinase/integrase [Rhodopseudomonas sp. BR0C11]
MTLADACDRFWNEHGRHLNDPDLKRQLDWLAANIGPQVRLHDITDNVVAEAVEKRRREVKPSGRDERGKKLHKPISNRTINNSVVSTLRRVIRRARKNWNVTVLNEPDWGAHMLKVIKRPVREITVAEDSAIDEVESRDYRELREFAEIMGLRRRELLLIWPQVDFELGIIRIVGKGGKPAVLPLSRRAYEILWGLRGNHPVSVFTFVAERTRRCPKTGTEFVRGQRYPMTYYGIGTNRRRKWTKAGVDARLHDTRHTTGMRTLRSTGNLKLVQKLLRHSKIATTSEFYADADIGDIRDGLEATARETEARRERSVENAKLRAAEGDGK